MIKTQMNKNRWRAAVLAVVVGIASLALAGCSSREEEKHIIPAEAAQAILGGLEFTDELLEAQGPAVDNYYTMDDKVAEYSIYISLSGGTAEEVAVLRVEKAADLDAAVAVLEKRVEVQKKLYADYLPDELAKLNKAVIESKGTTAILVVSDDSNAGKVARDLL